jgi:hypothetical protein
MLGEQLSAALAAPPVESPMVNPAAMAGGLIVKVAKLRNDLYPGRDAQGVLPIFVVGHEAMSETEWSDWVRKHGIPQYGAGYTERVIRDGIDLKEMLPTSGFGRHMRAGIRRQGLDVLERAAALISAVEKWPSLYNSIVEELGEQQMTLGALLDRIYNMPSPWDTGVGTYGTLGDVIRPSLGGSTPNF